ncbi:MAG: FKBP-type peptidyl-prolyl cis-trans isomerase [Bacteroidales bacterium]
MISQRCFQICALVIFGLIFIILPAGCSNTPEDEKNIVTRNQVEKTLMGANHKLVDAEQQEITDFIQRRNWDMEKTGSGLRYMFYHEGEGEPVQMDKVVEIKYEVSLLTGDVIYSSKDDGVMEFMLGKGSVEEGLEEGLLMMKENDKAIFILPSHLAHGVPGDGNKIPRRATIVYDVELTDVK